MNTWFHILQLNLQLERSWGGYWGAHVVVIHLKNEL